MSVLGEKVKYDYHMLFQNRFSALVKLNSLELFFLLSFLRTTRVDLEDHLWSQGPLFEKTCSILNEITNFNGTQTERFIFINQFKNNMHL